MSEELDSTTVPVDFVKEGGDWLAIFNPRVPRQMDVQLVARYLHEGCVSLEDLWLHSSLTPLYELVWFVV
jgi:hypothetical protein